MQTTEVLSMGSSWTRSKPIQVSEVTLGRARRSCPLMEKFP